MSAVIDSSSFDYTIEVSEESEDLSGSEELKPNGVTKHMLNAVGTDPYRGVIVGPGIDKEVLFSHWNLACKTEYPKNKVRSSTRHMLDHLGISPIEIRGSEATYKWEGSSVHVDIRQNMTIATAHSLAGLLFKVVPVITMSLACVAVLALLLVLYEQSYVFVPSAVFAIFVFSSITLIAHYIRKRTFDLY